MSKDAHRDQVRIAQLFAAPRSRNDLWRNLAELAEAWSRGSANRHLPCPARSARKIQDQFCVDPTPMPLRRHRGAETRACRRSGSRYWLGALMSGVNAFSTRLASEGLRVLYRM
jgi:hypothetical protein